MNAFLRIAHRGYSSKYPENTLPAFEAAVAAGADMIELDVRLSRDGEFVVIHDARIDRTSDGRGPVAGRTVAELRRYSYHNGMKGCGFVPIPTLTETIDRVGGRAVLNIEVKEDGSKRSGVEEKLVRLLRERGVVDRVIVSSFDRGILAGIRRADGRLKIGLICDTRCRGLREEVEALAPYSLHPSLALWDEVMLRWARSRGMRIYPWVAHRREAVERCRSSGLVDGVMVNDLALFGSI